MSDELHQTTWVLAGPVRTVAGAEVVMSFGEGTVSGCSGCNRFHGSYELRGEALAFGPLAGTLMACGDEAMVLEREVLRRLGEVTRAIIDRDALRLLAADDSLLLEFHAQSAADLEGDWVVTAVHHPQRAAIISSGEALPVRITADTIAGNAGCNMFHGPLVVAEGGVAIGPLRTTRKICHDDAADGGPSIMEREQALLAALEAATGYRLEGSRLTLLRGDGGISVSLQRA